MDEALLDEAPSPLRAIYRVMPPWVALALELHRRRDEHDVVVTWSERVTLPLAPFRAIIKDYFLICESYYAAIRRSSPSQIEAIDMGRRGLHNEGAALLRTRLENKAEIDNQTARRLFTLVCVLHQRI